MTRVVNTQNALIGAYTTLGTYMGLGTNASTPGSSATPANEVVGGSPAYARVLTNWSITGPVATGSAVTFNVPPGTYAYLLMCSGASGANMIDWSPVTQQVCANQTTITVIPMATAN